MDVDPEASLARARARNAAEPHRETRMDDAIHGLPPQSARRRITRWPPREPDRVRIVDGRAAMDAIEREVWEIVSAHV